MMTIKYIFKRAKWTLGKETPSEIHIGANFNPGVTFKAKDKSAKGLLTTIDGVSIYIDPELEGQKVRVIGKKKGKKKKPKEIIIDLAFVRRHKLKKVK